MKIKFKKLPKSKVTLDMYKYTSDDPEKYIANEPDVSYGNGWLIPPNFTNDNSKISYFRLKDKEDFSDIIEKLFNCLEPSRIDQSNIPAVQSMVLDVRCMCAKISIPINNLRRTIMDKLRNRHSITNICDVLSLESVCDDVDNMHTLMTTFGGLTRNRHVILLGDMLNREDSATDTKINNSVRTSMLSSIFVLDKDTIDNVALVNYLTYITSYLNTVYMYMSRMTDKELDECSITKAKIDAIHSICVKFDHMSHTALRAWVYHMNFKITRIKYTSIK